MSPPDDLPAIDPGPIRDELRAIYDELDAEVAHRGPTCQLSGRCCRFAEYGHTLFVSAIEAALLVADAPTPSRPLDNGATCPWQDDRGRCTARAARPIGCRAYYCDPAYEPDAHLVSEPSLGRLKRLADAQGLPWAYAPLHHHLHAARAAGRLAVAPGEVASTSPSTGRPHPEPIDIFP